MPEFEILQEGNALFHAYITIHFKAYVGNWVTWIDITNDVLCHHIQT